MLYYIIFGIILATILLTLFLELIHSSRQKFKKNLKFIILLFLLIIIAFVMTKFPQIISVIPAIFIILYRWRFLIEILSKVFLMKRDFKKNPDKLIKIWL